MSVVLAVCAKSGPAWGKRGEMGKCYSGEKTEYLDISSGHLLLMDASDCPTERAPQHNISRCMWNLLKFIDENALRRHRIR